MGWTKSHRSPGFSAPSQARHRFCLVICSERSEAPDGKPLKGFKGAGVLEIVTDHSGDTYRTVYTVRFAKAVYVLHAFKKKSKSGIKTPAQEIDLIHKRLTWAMEDYNQWLKENENEG